MKINALNSSNHSKGELHLQSAPNSEVLSRQIESLRLVSRRMKMNDSDKLDSIISQKLKAMQ